MTKHVGIVKLGGGGLDDCWLLKVFQKDEAPKVGLKMTWHR